MIRRIVLSMLMVLVAASQSLAAKVNIDYDDSYTKKVTTYQWVQSKQGAKSPLMDQRIVNAINHQLTDRGLSEVDTDPDIYVTYHASAREQLNIHTDNFGYGYPTTWHGGYGGGYYHGGYYGGVGTSTTTVSRWQIGTLVIDAWDGEDKDLIWRGTAEGTISSNPQKMERRINKAVNKLFKKWDKIRKKNAKK